MLNPEEKKEFIAARHDAIAREFEKLNPQQQQGVLKTQGAVLLLAGAGSGKTTVLIHRIENLMKYGDGSDSDFVPETATQADLSLLKTYLKTGEQNTRVKELCKVNPAAPWSILAITFTNRAAQELKDRLFARVGNSALDVWAATFHSACVRILRRDIDKLGFDTSFTIYDTDDSLRVIKACLRELEMDEKMYTPRMILGYISRAKDEMLMAEDYYDQAKKSSDFRAEKIANVYLQYEKRLRGANALDFDDIIFHTVRLLQKDEQVRTYYQKKFRYVLIDEYQDTNNLQYLLASILAGGWGNFCVVGDDDQSIYRFRGATIENILSFEAQYKGATVIKLEENYRSTQNILSGANAVIKNNLGRKGKQLWTAAGQGELIYLHSAMNEHEEAQYIAGQILDSYSDGKKWKDHAILYRMNAQSNQLELALKRNGIPYRIFGGTRFFERAEVKDMLAYLSAIHNPADDLRLLRIVNNPPRKIGATTIEKAQEIAAREDIPIMAIFDNAVEYETLQKAAPNLKIFVSLIQTLSALAQTLPLDEFYEQVMEKTGYLAMLENKNTIEDTGRAENVKELLTSIRGYMENSEGEVTLGGFLDEIALFTDMDTHDPNQDCVVMMTMHAAKGLEFPCVFIAGAEENVFPGQRSIGDAEEMEEERRLCYVAMTRAREKLTLTCARTRMLFGRTSGNMPSRFIGEIPQELVQRSGAESGFGVTDTAFGSMARGQSTYGGYSPSSARGAADYGGFVRATTRPSATTPHPKPSYAAASQYGSASAQKGQEFQQGEMVVHKVFGNGLITSVQKMGGDAMLEIAFDNIGTKRLMQKAAAAHMEKKSNN